MEKDNTKNKKTKRFLAVDVWRTHFGETSVKAIYDVYSMTFGIEPKNMHKYTFTQCVNGLRRHEDPDYVDPTNKSVKQITIE